MVYKKKRVFQKVCNLKNNKNAIFYDEYINHRRWHFLCQKRNKRVKLKYFSKIGYSILKKLSLRVYTSSEVVLLPYTHF